MAFVYWIHLEEHTDITKEGYIGFTSQSVKTRIRGHNKDRERYAHYPLYRAMKKYGDSIIVTTLIEGDSDYCLDVERKLRPSLNIGWNICVGGVGGHEGRKVSEETRKLMSESSKGRDVSAETRMKLSRANKGKVLSDETKLKISISHTGKKYSPERCKEISDILKNRPPASEETRRKLSIANKGRQPSALCRAKSIEANSKPWAEDRLQKRREKYALIPPWLNPKANVANWANAQYFHTRFHNGEQLKTIALSSGITENQLKTLVKHFRAGWNPNEDQNF